MASCKERFRGLVIVVMLFIILEFADAARSGGSRSSGSRRSGGSGSGGSRYVRSRYSFGLARGGYSTSSRSRVSIRYRTSRTYGVYYGAYNYYDDDVRSYTICVNYKESDENGTKIGKFVCPLYGQPQEYTYCCGERNEQFCCGFWDDSGRSAAVVGGIIGGSFLITIVTVVCLIVCGGCKGGGGGTSTFSYDSD